jgi:hypothetical protein
MSEAPSPTLELARDLIARNAALATRLSALGARGTAAAAALAGRGTPPSDDLVAELEGAGRDFAGLRAEALDAASAAGLAAPDAEHILSTRELETVLQALLAVVEAAARREAVERTRQQALGVLDRIDTLVHRDDPTFPALLLCQKRANEMRAALTAPVDADPEVQQAAAIEMTGPFVALLALLDGGRHFSDEQWTALEDAVVTAFGRPLVAAATRGRLRPR